jgi:hypothetical protein
VHRNPSSLLPVIISEEVNKSGLGKELLLLNWTVQHLQVASLLPRLFFSVLGC